MEAAFQRDDEGSWYLIQCKPRQDDRAEVNLLRQGYQLYRPKLMAKRHFKDQRKDCFQSLFPGYLFIRLGLQNNWAPVTSTRGVAKIVRFGDYPLPVSDKLINELKLRQYEHAEEAPFSEGDKVRIKDGPFSDMEAIFVTSHGDERVVLLLNLLNRQQQIRVRRAAVTTI
ncbi:transcription/translation regulatory transformer protein RfaH [Pseudomonas asiatica]|uniref:transcription/translation regulatory transformer protein RfaH n=1 Tax=Pseudomonas asiatica TaxID=2219225 RepID=UPI002E7BD032|nr:transcription/translation regulatory transformer protein RfaH [Pseudomonas asiatica]MEE1920261.1 transcription/translation regulatory transformer protein RfaH [Pseudomonas asiatica]